jgi:4-amino-4-deoxy-L-arabinose transferase-like glycosyltransferase
MEPPLFTEAEHFFHHPPIYVLLVKAFGSGPRFLVGLQALVALQHALVVCLALGVERVTRLETESPLAAALAGIFIACDPHLALYAQLVLTEVVAISFALGGVVLLFEAARRERADRWLFAAGASAALATLTRQAFEFWPFVAAAWLLAAGPVRPRRRAAAIFFVAAYLPLLPFVLHNHVFFGRPALTAATGRNLVYRVCEGLPDLTDAKAPPGDELERARRRIHENRDRLWKGAYDAVAADLGWSDDRIDAAVQRFYFEQVFKYPAEFTRVTVAYVCQLLVATETIGSILELHNLTRPVASQPWDLLPHAEPAPAWLEAVNGAEPTSAPSFLMFAAVAPLLARGRARRLALLAVASVGYVVVLTSLVELPVFRYRLPAVPFMVLACAAAATGLVAHLRAMGGRR